MMRVRRKKRSGIGEKRAAGLPILPGCESTNRRVRPNQDRRIGSVHMICHRALKQLRELIEQFEA